MANPKPTFFTTGNYESRDKLRSAIRTFRRHGMNWKTIAKETGVSHRTAKRVFEEDEAIRKEARALAYSRSQSCIGGTSTAPDPMPSPFKAATLIYTLLLSAIFLFCITLALASR